MGSAVRASYKFAILLVLITFAMGPALAEISPDQALELLRKSFLCATAPVGESRQGFAGHYLTERQYSGDARQMTFSENTNGFSHELKKNEVKPVGIVAITTVNFSAIKVGDYNDEMLILTCVPDRPCIRVTKNGETWDDNSTSVPFCDASTAENAKIAIEALIQANANNSQAQTPIEPSLKPPHRSNGWNDSDLFSPKIINGVKTKP
jgi:hypothetical protein